MRNDLPPPIGLLDIVQGKMRLVDGLKPGLKTFLDVAEGRRWSKNVADQESWLKMAEVQLHLRLSSKFVADRCDGLVQFGRRRLW